MFRRSAFARLMVLSAAALAQAATAGTAHGLVWPDVPERVEQSLGSPDVSARRAAARELPSLGAARATPLVLRAMGDADVEVRLASARAAIRLQIPAATNLALQWLTERDPRLRVAACEVAQATPAPSAVPALARALGDPDPAVRAAAADALGAQQSSEALTPLAGKLDDSTPNVRVQVARALARLADPRAVAPLVGKVQDSVPEVRQAVVRALGDLGDTRATQALLLALRDNAVEVKVDALGALGRLRAPEAVYAIAPLSVDRNPTVQKAALAALGRIATPDAVRALVRAASLSDDGSPMNRSAAREALATAGAPAVAELTTQLERSTSPQLAATAAWVLGELRATGSAKVIVAALRRGALAPTPALSALAGAGTAEQVPIVLEFVSDEAESVREAALRAAAALLDPRKPDGRAVEPLTHALRSPRTSPAERTQLATLLGRTGAPRAASELAPLVNAKDRGLRLAAIDALGALGSGRDAAAESAIDGALVPLVEDVDPGVRLRAAVALGASGGAKAIETLLSKLDEQDEIDRFAVLTALGGLLERHPDERAARRLMASLPLAAGGERDAIIEAASRAKVPSVIAALSTVAKGGEEDRRAVAAAVGAQAGSSAAVALAKSLAEDRAASVRAQAAFALGALGDTSVTKLLVARASDPDPHVATNAAGGLARLASPASAATVGPSLCALALDKRAAVRANALAGIARAKFRCGDGRAIRKLLAEDPADLVRSAAARALIASSHAGSKTPTGGAASGPSVDDSAALERCANGDRSPETARVCRGGAAPPTTTDGPRAITVFVAGDVGTDPKPRAPYLVELEGGILRAGLADRRGALFEPAAPAGYVTRRRVPD